MAPGVTEKESADWGKALEAVLVDLALSSVNFFFATPTSIDNAIEASVGKRPLSGYSCWHTNAL